MTRRTQYYWDPARRASSVDHLIFEPRSNMQGGRSPVMYGSDYEFLWEPSRLVSEEEWMDYRAGTVAAEIQSKFSRFVDSFRGWMVGSGRFACSFETNNPMLVPKVKRLASDRGVRVEVERLGVNHIRINLLDPAEKMSGLYLHGNGAEMVPSSPADVGAILARSGRSGYRGARDTLNRGLFGPEESPKPDFETYGMSPRYEHSVFGSYEGGLETLIFGAVAVLATYRVLGGKPIFKL